MMRLDLGSNQLERAAVAELFGNVCQLLVH
jgi:hypothetical protein